MGGTIREEGRVEFCLNNNWRTVCDYSWDDDDASVACRQLGYSPQEARAIRQGLFGLSYDSGIVLDLVNCVGTEDRLDDCPFITSIYSSGYCEDAVAGVRLTPKVDHRTDIK